MINRQHPSDLARFRHTDFGYFAPVPVLAELAVKLVPPSTEYAVMAGGIARWSTPTICHAEMPEQVESRGGRIQFKGRGGGRW